MLKNFPGPKVKIPSPENHVLKTGPSVGRGLKTRRTGPRISRPVLPQNVVGRRGRFCRGTSSEGQTGSAAERHVERTDRRHVERTDRLRDLIYKIAPLPLLFKD
jgi:hypothetical protein